MKPCLLIAESDPAFAAIYQRFLSRYGCAVVSASGGLECLEKLRRTSPEVLVLSGELLWGGSDGVLAQLREEDDLPSVPVILVGTEEYGTDRRPPAATAVLEWPVVDRLQ